MTQIPFLRPENTFIIAEAGVNHNADLEKAHKMVDAAADAGADAVKFQTWKAEGLVTPEAPKAEYQRRTTGSGGNQLDMLRRLELPEEAHAALIDHCAERDIMFLSTAHDWEAIDILDRLNVPAYKVGSGDLTNLPFLSHMASRKRPIILSTGMGNLSEVEEAVEAIRQQGNDQLILLHCTTSYPAHTEDVNLRAMITLRQAFNVTTGYSDHTNGSEIAIAAVAMGAKVIEKHFTLDRTLPGPDHEASLEPKDLQAMIQSIRRIELSLGDGIKKPKYAERDITPVARKSIVAASDIKPGTVITADMITTKRPGSGILPRYWYDMIGRTARTTIPSDTLIRWDMMEAHR